ncbi:MAG: hypothetical protein HY720_28625 [Planctomycetes bacterium]|nr:hypothetical protein [Planctomycetota bacterium]
MPRTKVKDLPNDRTMTPEELKKVGGGAAPLVDKPSLHEVPLPTPPGPNEEVLAGLPEQANPPFAR